MSDTDPHAPLTNGWEVDLPDSDNIARAAIRNVAHRLLFTAERMGGEAAQWDDLVAVKMPAAASSMWVNVAAVLQPVDTGRSESLADRLDDFYGPGTPATVFSPHPTADLRERGYMAMGHPPLMLRVPGGDPRPDPDGLTVEECTDADTLAEWEQAEAHGFPLTAEATTWERGSLFDERVLGGPLRFWLGRVDGTPVAASAAYVAHGVTQVEFIATMPEYRGRGIGEAMTWRAVQADASLPAVLIASDMGRPVYERMGFVSLFRYTGWIRPGATRPGA